MFNLQCNFSIYRSINIIYLFTGLEEDMKFVIPRDSNYFYLKLRDKKFDIVRKVGKKLKVFFSNYAGFLDAKQNTFWTLNITKSIRHNIA